ncbi:GNAT family N-acetyltransferase [Tumebacillus amylolyticus]|uniref:GNAT family N-acetyltransferase n=1 Tax=Tumebacillus amylolyticus TaxID=2801339 RepID=UPI003221B360
MHSVFSFECFPKFEVEGYRLRALRADDVGALFSIGSDLEVMKYNDDPMVEMEEAVKRFEMHELEFKEKRSIRWGIARKEDDRLVGTVLMYKLSRKFASAEIGFELAKEFWGRGVMTEVLEQVVQFGFEELALNRLEASFATENVGSRRVLEKNGFVYEGTLRDKWYMNGRYWDGVVMGLLRKDYLAWKDGR